MRCRVVVANHWYQRPCMQLEPQSDSDMIVRKHFSSSHQSTARNNPVEMWCLSRCTVQCIVYAGYNGICTHQLDEADYL